MDELKKKIEQILDQFAIENGVAVPNFGPTNRLNQFLIVSLKSVISAQIDEFVSSMKKDAIPPDEGNK